MKNNWWGIRVHVFVHYTGGLNLVPFLNALGVTREYPRDLEICCCGTESPGGTRKSPPGSLYLAELVVIHREYVKLDAKCGASPQHPLPLSDFWENRALHCYSFLDIFVFIFWNNYVMSTKELLKRGIVQIQLWGVYFGVFVFKSAGCCSSPTSVAFPFL